MLGDGSVVSHLSGLPKDNTGYDLAGLLTGSEGTLGHRHRGAPAAGPPARRIGSRPAWASPGIAEAVAAVGALRPAALAGGGGAGSRRRGRPCRLDPGAGTAAGAPGACRHSSSRRRGDADPARGPGRRRRRPLDDGRAGRGDVRRSQRRRLWQVREGFADAINRLGPPDQARRLRAPGPHRSIRGGVPARLPSGARLVVFGHLGDGNLHVNVTGVRSGADRRGPSVEQAVLEVVVAAGGSISAEHGIGTAKAPLPRTCAARRPRSRPSAPSRARSTPRASSTPTPSSRPPDPLVRPRRARCGPRSAGQTSSERSGSELRVGAELDQEVVGVTDVDGVGDAAGAEARALGLDDQVGSIA